MNAPIILRREAPLLRQLRAEGMSVLLVEHDMGFVMDIADRIVVLEFPSIAAWESFYNGPVYQGLKAVRDECSTARLVAVEGIDS